MRKLLARIIASITALVLVPVEVVVNGVRMIVSALVPARNTGSLDAAAEIVAEDDASDQLAALAAAKAAWAFTPRVRPSEPERVRQAAGELRAGRSVSRCLFDPTVPDEAEVLTWLAGLDQLHLGHLIRASDARIEAHLAGEKYLPLPLLPEDERKAVEEREALRMPTELEWTQILIARRVENGDEPDGDQLDDLIREARQLAETRARVGDHLPRRVDVRSRCVEDA